MTTIERILSEKSLEDTVIEVYQPHQSDCSEINIADILSYRYLGNEYILKDIADDNIIDYGYIVTDDYNKITKKQIENEMVLLVLIGI